MSSVMITGSWTSLEVRDDENRLFLRLLLDDMAMPPMVQKEPLIFTVDRPCWGVSTGGVESGTATGRRE
jgi:hypothetical protein